MSKNPDEARAHQRKWYALNKDQQNEKRTARRKLRRDNNTDSCLNNKIAVVLRHGGKCAVCGYSACITALDLHHVEPRCCHREHHHGGMEYHEA